MLIEVTEDSFLSDPERARQMLVQAHEHGVETAIDDYGTGFSSLSYLRDLPVQELARPLVLLDGEHRRAQPADRHRDHADGARPRPAAGRRGRRGRRDGRACWPRPASTCCRATTWPAPCRRTRCCRGCGGARPWPPPVRLGVSRPPALRTAPAS
nr:EAL domain-containing protein [Angustibacter aerolatus]